MKLFFTMLMIFVSNQALAANPTKVSENASVIHAHSSREVSGLKVYQITTTFKKDPSLPLRLFTQSFCKDGEKAVSGGCSIKKGPSKGVIVRTEANTDREQLCNFSAEVDVDG